MQELIAAVEQIRQVPGAFVDSNFLQGGDVILERLQGRSGKEEEPAVEVFVENVRQMIVTLQERSAPFDVPDDYIFFLEYYGGLFIRGDNYTLSVLGTGPMVEDMYFSIDSDYAFPEPGQYGFLSLGTLGFSSTSYRHIQTVTFVLDLAGNIGQFSVIGIGPYRASAQIQPFEIVKKIHDYPETWQKVSDSFTGWLVRIAETDGKLGYVSSS